MRIPGDLCELKKQKTVNREREGERMGETEEENKRKNRERTATQSLGWLTESSIMPKKQKAISGVGPSSILDLKAQLYKSQQDLKRSKDLSSDCHVNYMPAKTKIASKDPLSLNNSGVHSRALKDKIELKAVTDGTASYAALERKAELYEKLAKGELSDEEDKEKYCVDFSSKSFPQDRPQQSQGYNSFHFNSLKDEDERDDDATSSKSPSQSAATLDQAEHMRFVREVHEEANQAREKVSELRLRRQEQVTARREKLKQAYLKKQLDKLKAASTQQT